MGADPGVAAQGPPPAYVTVIPQPLAQAPERGAFTLQPSARIVVRSTSSEAARVAQLLAAALRPATGYRLPVVTARGGDAADGIALALTPGDRALGNEGYRLVVAREGVTVTAARPAGLFYGTQTLRQLLPAAIEADTLQPGPWRIALGTIHDRPRFVWRGAMLDVARHFFPPAEVKRLIDLMALYKLNRLHLHLSDDQGWRIAIRSWPRLTSVGGRSAVGGGKGGYFTQRDYASHRRVRPRAVRRRRPRDRHARARQRRAHRVREAQLRRHRAGPAHGHRGRLQLALHPQGADVPVRRRRRPRGRSAHARPVPPRRRRRGELDRSGRVPRLHGAGRDDRPLARQADDRLGGGREDEAAADVGCAALARPGGSRAGPSQQGRS